MAYIMNLKYTKYSSSSFEIIVFKIKKVVILDYCTFFQGILEIITK